MKKYLFLIFLPMLLFSQKTEYIKLKMPLKDFTNTTKSFTVKDIRIDKTFKKMVFRGNEYKMSFPTNDVQKDVTDWFYRANKNLKGNRDLVFMIENLQFGNEVKEGNIYCILEMKLSIFLKNENQYFLLGRNENVVKLNAKGTPGIPSDYAENLQKVMQTLIADAFRAEPHSMGFSEEQLPNYYTLIQQNLPAFTTSELKEGVYTDYFTFLEQQPLEGFSIVKNEEKVQKAESKSSGKTLPQRKIMIYVENGKAYKNTAMGFLPLQKDEHGYYIVANRLALFPEEIKVSSVYFFFGIIGGLAAAIDATVQYDKIKKADMYPIYIDNVNGNYIFVK